VEQPCRGLADIHGDVKTPEHVDAGKRCRLFRPLKDVGQGLAARSRRKLQKFVPHPGAPEIVKPVEHLAIEDAVDLGDNSAGRLEGFCGPHRDLAHRRHRRPHWSRPDFS